MTRQVRVGSVAIGGGAPISVQSMTNTDTADAPATLAQIRTLAAAGCDIVRMTVNTKAAADAVSEIVAQSPVPLVADIHFDHRLAIRAIESGIAKVRINPGNIGGAANIRALCDCLRAHHIPVRVGVNAGSLEKDILEKYGGPTAKGLVESALSHARLLEKHGFDDIVISVKASDPRLNYEAYVLAHETCDYPLHVGVTEAGLPEDAIVKSSVGIGALLLQGIGDTVRVSLTGDPVPEAAAALSILRACGLRRDYVEVIACPTCGRTGIDVPGIARRVRAATRNIHKPLKVAVMGCVVNGPGEAREADVGIAGGKTGGILFKKGCEPVVIRGDLEGALLCEIQKMV